MRGFFSSPPSNSWLPAAFLLLSFPIILGPLLVVVEVVEVGNERTAIFRRLVGDTSATLGRSIGSPSAPLSPPSFVR